MPAMMFSVSRGIGLFLVGMFFFSCMNVAIRSLATTLDPVQMVFMRNGFSLLLLLPLACKHGAQAWKTDRFPRHLLRAIIGLCAMETWFVALTHLPVNTATALSFTAPLFSTLFAVLFLQERMGWRRACALAVGFSGVLVVANPFGQGAWNGYMVVALISAALMAVAGIMVKTLTRTEPSWRIVLYVSFLMSVMSFPPAMFVWQTPDAHTLTITMLIAALATCAQLCLVQALSLEKIVVLTPFEFVRLLFTAVLAWMVLGEGITYHTIMGSALIVGSTVFIVWREAAQKRRTAVAGAIG
jgi:drug/metabolite transporter (DMT)-like permease